MELEKNRNNFGFETTCSMISSATHFLNNNRDFKSISFFDLKSENDHFWNIFNENEKEYNMVNLRSNLNN